MVNAYFFDSYALVEITKGNPRYISYTDSQIVITVFNLTEFTYSVLTDHGKEKAAQLCKKFDECVYDIDEATVFEAMEFRKEHKKRNLSYADCIGYVFARKNKLKFLTGDEQFRNFDNVEFVKAQEDKQ
jgi:predicted nucleic acid-binding protein